MDESKTVYYFDATPNLNKYAKAEEGFSQTAITTTPKLYVHFEKTDVAANAQTLTIEGFANDGGLGKNEINKTLEVPSNLVCPEESKTPTSLTLSWDKVDQAKSYELMVDGIINQMGDVNTYTNIDLVYNSTHTYQIRARNLDGYSEWSEELTTQTLQDPWRNVPDSKVTWNGGEQYGKISNAFDHNFQTMFHSTGNALNDDFVIDLQKAYEVDEFEYYPRGNGGNGEGTVGARNNGTVTKMDVYTSMDGAHWSKQQDGKVTPWTYTAGKSIEESIQKVKLSGAARYVKLRVVESIGNFFAANQLVVYKKDGSSGFALGSNTMKPEVSEGDITNMNNYLASANRANDAPTFDAQIKKHYADLNNNDIYDVYDYAFTLFNIDGGTQQKGKADGNILIIPSKKDIAAGEEFTIDFYGSDLKNINAFGAWFDYDPSKFEYVDIEKGANISSMGNYSMNKLYNDGTAMYNLAMVNRGNKQTFSGDGLLASIKMRAKIAGEALVPTKSIIIGPTFDFKEIDCSQSNIEIPDIPLSKESLYSKENFDLRMTNDKLTTDDGTNVNKLIHTNTYDGLFDANENDFEFKWNYGDTATDEETLAYRKEWVKLPTTIHYKFKKEDSLHKNKLTNRAGLGNGAISGLLYTIHFTDGTSESKEFTTKTLTYEYLIKDNTKKVKQVDIELRGAKEGDKVLTLSQIELSRLDTQVVEGVELDTKNAKEIFVNDITTVQAKVKPDDIANPYYKVSSSDESIVSVLTIQDSTGIQYFLKGNTAGKAIITVSSAGDPAKSSSYEVNVKQGVSTKVLDQAIQKGMTYIDVYTSKTYQDLQDAIKAGEKLLENANYTKEEINKAAIDIEEAIIKLVIRPIDESQLINTDAKTKVSIKDFSSERGPDSGDPSLASATLDYDENSFWHSEYSANLGMPQHITLDLKGRYKLSNVTFLPRQSAANGDIIKAHIETSSDYKIWSKYPSQTFENDGSSLLNKADYKVLTLPKSETRYVRFVVENTLGNENDQYASMAEIRVYGEYTGAKKELLQKFYDENVNKKNEGYTPNSWATFANTLIDAKNLLDDVNAIQKDVDEGLTKLQSSIDNLKKMADFTKLKATIDQANGIQSKLYTAASYNAVYKALQIANQLVIDFNATQENVDAAKNALSEAILGLVLVATNPISPSIPNDAIMNADGTVTVPNADKNMSITGDIDVDASFVTTSLDAKQIDSLKKKIKDQDFLKNYKIEKVYDISIMKNGDTAQKPGKKTIRILLDEILMNKTMQVVYFAEYGTIQFMESRQEDDYIEFDTTHNSYYGLVSKTNSNTVNTGDDTMIGAMLFIFTMSGAALLLIVNNKRKKQYN